MAMKKQQFSLSLVLTLIISGYLAGAPMRVYAGSAGITGGSEDSSSSSGDSFNPADSQSSPELAPGVNVEISGDGSLSISAETQSSLNAAIANILSQTPAANSVAANIIAILQGGANASAAANQLQSSLVSLGVPGSSAQALVSALLGLAGNKSASASGFTVGTKGLITNSVIAQKEASPTLNINNLNAAINAYNKIVMESSPEVLQQLAKDANFREIGNLLKQLRAALSQS
ncbi:hypothetical protein GNE08_12370 [Trichormus variabilis ARAD]|nr:hypothetical protein [Trichormus variabilis ARAD]MBC1255078.1 hypothetical protein [Trichormus variabilis V5]MBC1270260.1 hypothetical protein [Trichormus variabilis FSR]MBC1300916.1 hypothetical protein [Trichormus variabilis N2B]MBC1313388.1 hypothetical protein [Trichormus variabilis PNB]MBC1327427.1 hypothetical protein [Trichormus variabilis 9RC]MBD2379918.1 hypothetical protein [Trichormus variabilis FACHB-319]QFZ14089.1 hypothetical protein EH233_19855 [Anabaena sp. YBS01]QHD83180